MTEKNILNLMIVQHELLASLFSIFMNELKSQSENVKNSLSELINEMKNHFFVEEEIIFSFMAWKDPDITETINHLKKEHSVAIDEVEKMFEDLGLASEERLGSLSKLLGGHRETEERILYPKLDESLSPAQKQQIVDRINEVKK